jgi:hypothetical protein
LRASAETDLLEQFPISAVTEWLGHSAAVALKRYTRVPDHLFERAANGGAECGAVVVQKSVQSTADVNGQKMTEATETLQRESFRRLLSGLGLSSPNDLMTLWGFEPQYRP